MFSSYAPTISKNRITTKKDEIIPYSNSIQESATDPVQDALRQLILSHLRFLALHISRSDPLKKAPL